MDQKITFGYWGTRGRGQVSRLLLAYTGAVWEDLKYTEPEQWFGGDREELGFDFPNLPYLIEGEYKLTESTAIQRYIIQRSNKKELLGKNIKDEGTVNCMIGILGDIKYELFPLFFNPNWKEAVDQSLQKIKPKVDILQKYFGNKEFALGYITLFDFQMVEFSYYIQKLSPQIYENSFMKKNREAFNQLPDIKKYYEQPSSLKGPFLPKISVIPI